MYEQHIALSSPPDTTRIWRFMDLGKFISALHTSSLFFCRADLLRDPYECMPNEKMIEDYAKRVPRADNRFLEDMRQMTVANRLWTYINSWHMNEFESAAMWELYLKNQEGIAIETDFARLRDCFSAEESHLVFIGAVNTWITRPRSFLGKTASMPLFTNGKALSMNANCAQSSG
jgi:hypothetical protein